MAWDKEVKTTVDTETFEQIPQVAAAIGVGKATLLRMAIIDYVKRHNTKEAK